MNEWEYIAYMTDRMKLPAGWLVKTTESIEYQTEYGVEYVISTSMVYVPDLNHEWKVEEKK